MAKLSLFILLLTACFAGSSLCGTPGTPEDTVTFNPRYTVLAGFAKKSPLAKPSKVPTCKRVRQSESVHDKNIKRALHDCVLSLSVCAYQFILYQLVSLLV